LGKPLDRSILDGKSIEIFRAAIKSDKTRDPYERRLVGFLNAYRMTCDEFVKQAKKNRAKTEQLVIDFIIKEKKRAESRQISNSTVSNTIKPVKLLLDMNDVVLNWKKIKRLMPSQRRYALDRIPNMDELRQIVSRCDERMLALTLLLCSSGIREGAVESLNVKNVSPVKQNDRVFGRIVVYEGEEEQYVAFITPEAYEALQQYLDWRKMHGEDLSGESPLFRDKFDATLTQKFLTYGGGIPERPKRMDGAAIRMAYNRMFHELGFRDGPKRRHDFSVHSMGRKWFKTKMENAGAKPIITELLLGHSVGISDSYYRPSEKDLFDEYSKSADSLAILRETELQIQNHAQRQEFEEQLQSVNQKVDRLIAQFAEGRPSRR
jgi:integrase